MGCCDETKASGGEITRRTVLTGTAAAIGAASLAGKASAQQQPLKSIQLAFCSQLLCITPYEVARAAGHFRDHGLDVELVYSRGGAAAMQALVGGAVDYAATSLDVAMQAYANGAMIRRFATTGRLPLFALATAPQKASTIQGLKDLEGKTVGISALGNADHALLLFLLKGAGADASKVQFATIGVNILEALRQGQVDAGLVQEPALTILQEAGSRVLVNAMDSADAQRYLGGPYEFMGVAVRANELDRRRPEMQMLAAALKDALVHLQQMSAQDLVGVYPKEVLAGADLNQTGQIIARYKASLYPTEVAIDLTSSQRVFDTLKFAGLIKSDLNVQSLFDTTIARG